MKKAPQADFPAFEAEMLKAWSDEKTFEASLKNREGKPRYSFYDGPPFANGLPHFGHSLVTAIKDSLGRYHTMQGEYVERRNGWDTHGLPVEFAIEKELGVSGKKQILELGLAKFNEACRASVFKYKGDWEEFFRRIGRWTDTENAYATIDRDYTESVWWMLGRVNEKGLLYRGYKSMPYCPRCETPLSNFEVNEGYKDDVPDPSLYVKFKLVDEDASLLAWTTTPWSLSGNGAVAVHPDEAYVYVQTTEGDEVLVLAEKRLSALKGDDFTVLKKVSARELAGKRYEPLFTVEGLDKLEGYENLYQVRLSDTVSVEDGTGVLHVSAAYGEEDLKIGQDNGFPVLTTVDTSGRVKPGMGLDEVEGVFFKEADPAIVEHLTRAGRVYAAETFTHTYPFCYRCDSPLLYYAITTWFVKVSAVRDDMMRTAEQIHWQPAHIKDGRFGKWLEGARDWAISRNRYWGAPLPIWVNEKDADDYLVVGSLDELVKLAGLEGKPEDLHRPGIDEVVIRKDGKVYKRVEEVFDCWFESGSMPVAQQHYPFENETVFDESFPADYVGEGLDQTRLWFYVLHVLSTIAFDRPAYKNVLVNGMVMAADGQKLSKRLRNYPPVEDVFATEGADTLRFYLLGNDQAVGADYMRFNREAMRDIQRNVFGTLWNSYSFLSMYAEIDGWKPGKKLVRPASDNVLDRWMLARLDETTTAMTTAADAYELAQALRPLRLLIDDLSNWYVRRSRRRFWKSEDDGDKHGAYVTLHYTLARIAQLLAPWSPFVADKLWRGLTEGMDEVVSVHLSDWPEAGEVDARLIREMALTREAITMGLAKRAEAKIKVRQPLAKATVRDTLDPTYEASGQLKALVAEELNVKQVVVAASGDPDHVAGTAMVELDIEITLELKAEGLMREVVRQVQSARKAAGLEVDDRIVLTLATEAPELAAALRTHGETIKTETLATKLLTTGATGEVPVKVDGAELYIGIVKA
ncbi:MAG TPA: isoleucine--tRNA ligase [Candidatus Saccharimonadia bacterium]|nr:isoleucine--tRNA ligase [Candidatus Saccharimonadia bacterium]